jgi:NAD(P)-dependent dehydrogenase (short-subunit alcohol dehydrogenase family)
MTGPVAFVTGSSRGIGAAIARVLRDSGMRVIGHATRAVDGETIAADLAEPGAPARIWEEATVRASGRIDVLVNNAGRFEENPIELPDTEWTENWEQTLRINLAAAAELSRHAVRHWLAQDRPGRIVHIASRAGHRGDSPDHWHYAASKGGMLALHKTIARQYAARGILSYAVCPGFTDTDMAADCLSGPNAAKMLEEIPLGRVATADEIAIIAAFCALDAPESMTGAVIDANGASHVR